MAVLIPAQGGGSTISNGQIINGVANFWQTSAPTTRVGGAALVAGDLWYNPNTGILGFWRSPYWLNTTTTVVNFPSVATVNLATVTSSPAYAPNNMFWESFTGAVADTSGVAGSDEASIGLVEILARAQANGTGTTRQTIFSENLNITGLLPNSSNATFTRNINTAVTVSAQVSQTWLSYVFTIYGVGINPGVSLSARARLIL